MDGRQTTEYIRTHLDFVGCDKEIFSEAAIDDVFKYFGGIPRLINKTCTSSLLYGAQNHKSIIDDRMVGLVIQCELSEGAAMMKHVSIPLSLLERTIDVLDGLEWEYLQ